MVKNEQDVVYIGIDEPAVVRKGLLEASKSLVHILKSQHNLLETRAVKQKGVEELRTTISEINEMLAVVKQLMPHTEKLNSTISVKQHIEPSSKKPRKAMPVDPAAIENKTNKFEMQLQDIEDKLKTL